MTVRCTSKNYKLLYWPDANLYKHDPARAHYAPDAPLDERGGNRYFVETSFIEAVQGPQKIRPADLYTVADLSAKPDFVCMTSLPLYPVYSQQGRDEFGTDCYFVPSWLLRTIAQEFSAYQPETLHYILRPFF